MLPRLALVAAALALGLAGAGAPAAADPEAPAKAKPTRAAKAKPKPKTKRTKAKPKRKRKVASRYESPADGATSPAYRYGQLTPEACEAELVARDVPFVRETARGVAAPVRLTGPLHGVTYRTNLREQARATTHWEIADCRLVLALDDFARVLAAHDVVEVRHYSMYRPPPRSWPDDKLATRHGGAVALDAGRFVTRDGTVLDVDRDFHGAIGAKTCGPGAAPRRPTPAALALRAILCDAVEQRLFNVVLTPNYNRPHKNHFHLEVTVGAKWFLVH